MPSLAVYRICGRAVMQGGIAVARGVRVCCYRIVSACLTRCRYYLVADPCGFVIVLLLCNGLTLAASPPGMAVVTAHEAASDAGMAVLEDGGNAFDAAVTIAAVLAVVEPYASGLGGGGFWLVYRAADQKQVMIDGREIAPKDSRAEQFLDAAGSVDRDKALNHPLAAGIPGTVAALAHLQQHYSRLDFARLLAPAIRLAEQGFPVTERYLRLLRFREKIIRRYPYTAGLLIPDGVLPDLGSVIVQKDLARTLRRLADYGAVDFYHGDLARQLVSGVRAAGGIWTIQDLAHYAVVERAPVVFQYRGFRVISAPPPSSGGVALAQALGMLEHFDLGRISTLDRVHLIAEAMRRAYQDRMRYLGDPDHTDIPLQALLDPAYLSQRAMSIDVHRVTASQTLNPVPLPSSPPRSRGMDTTHFSILDREGNRVAATLSINLPFGSGFMVPGTGVLLNNELDDFSLQTDAPNHYQLLGTKANALAPGKRPLSSMSPSFVESDEQLAILGTPGGSRIISMVMLAILDLVAGHPPQVWVSRPRYHHQFFPDQLLFEPAAFNTLARRQLRAKGHVLKMYHRRYGNMQAILWHKASPILSVGVDPRGEGRARTVYLNSTDRIMRSRRH